MSQSALLSDVVAVLHRLNIPFMLSGSHASSLQGQARSTHDIDLVVSLTAADVQPLVEAFDGERFYLSKTAMQEAVRDKRTFNLLEVTTGDKVDFWLLTDSPFDQSRFGRRQRIDLNGQPVDVSSPEDTILMKLSWCSTSGGSEKQFNDVLQIYEVQADLLDHEYIERWLDTLGVSDLWQRIKDKAEPFDLTGGT
jgi:hypothetical protein